MPEIINKDGVDVEVYTAEELEAQKQEALEQFRAENPDKTEELTKLQLELEGLKNKDMNFANVRKAKEEAEKKVEDLLKGVDEKIDKVKREVFEGVLQGHKSKTLSALVGDDVELKKKVELEYSRLSDVASTEEQITKKLKDAYVLATAKDPDGVNMSVFSSGGVGRIKINPTSQKFSPEEQALGAKFGLEADDFKAK